MQPLCCLELIDRTHGYLAKALQCLLGRREGGGTWTKPSLDLPFLPAGVDGSSACIVLRRKLAKHRHEIFKSHRGGVYFLRLGALWTL